MSSKPPPLDEMLAELAQRERDACIGGFTLVETKDGYGQRRWLVMHPLPHGCPYGRAYLRRDGRWSLTACHGNMAAPKDGPNEPDSAYFQSDIEAEAAMRAASPPVVLYHGNAVEISSESAVSAKAKSRGLRALLVGMFSKATGATP